MTFQNKDLRSPLSRSFESNWNARLWFSFHTAIPDSYSCLYTPDPTSEPLREAKSKNRTLTGPQFQSIFPTITVLESTTGASPRAQCHSHQAPAMVSAPHTASLSCDALSVQPQLQGNRQRGLIKASCPHQPPGNEEPGSFLSRSLPSHQANSLRR